MAKDDYYVLAYRILAYLYECVKQGQQPDLDYLTYDTKQFPVNESYWNYVLANLLQEGYIEGVYLVPILGRNDKGIKGMQDIRITPKGIEYLQENSMMKKAGKVLKELKELVPGLL